MRHYRRGGIAQAEACGSGGTPVGNRCHTAEACVAGDEYDLLFVGRLTEMKQPDQFVRIVAEVRSAVPSVRAAIVGDGPLAPMLRELADELGVRDHVDLLGPCADVGPILARSRIFVMTSRSEGLSIALLEAMAAGLPAVVADVGELGEAVTSGETGWLTRPDAIDEYAGRIAALLEDRTAYAAMSRAARERARSLASFDAVRGRWRRALDAMSGFDTVPNVNAKAEVCGRS